MGLGVLCLQEADCIPSIYVRVIRMNEEKKIVECEYCCTPYVMVKVEVEGYTIWRKGYVDCDCMREVSE